MCFRDIIISIDRQTSLSGALWKQPYAKTPLDSAGALSAQATRFAAEELLLHRACEPLNQARSAPAYPAHVDFAPRGSHLASAIVQCCVEGR